MTISRIAGALETALREATGRLSLNADQAFADTLTVGQIIKGRVLRHYDGTRYGVEFSGQEKVVDSAVPLKTGELIQGRVVGIGEKVELQRVSSREPHAAGSTSQRNEPLPSATPLADSIGAVAAKYGISLTDAEQATIARAGATANDVQWTAMAAVALRKLGLDVTPELLHAIRANLAPVKSPRGGVSDPALIVEMRRGPQGFVDASTVQTMAESVTEGLNAAIRKREQMKGGEQAGVSNAAEGNPAVHAGPSGGENDDAGGGDARDLGRWILNAQSEGVVSHRLGAFTFRLHDEIVEVDIALFEQRQPRPQQASRHRQVNFALNLSQLGHVEVIARVTDKHVRLQVTADRSDSSQFLARYVHPLRETLSEFGWQIDELAYATNEPNDGLPARTVLEHIIGQDSLNRLM